MIFKKKALVLALLTVYLESGQARAHSPLSPASKELAASLAESRAKAGGDAAEKLRKTGFKALDDNNLPLAEASFQELIKSSPRDSAAYGGLGLVKMHQDAFAESRRLLKKALDLSPSGHKDQWKPAFDRASYGLMISDARSAFESRHSTKGIALLRKAVEMAPRESMAILQLANALLAENDLPGAEANFRLVLKEDKNNQVALDGLISLLASQKRSKEIEELSVSMSPRQTRLLAELKARQLWDQAEAATAAGNIAKAQTSLEDAIAMTPDNPKLRLALARIYLENNAPVAARALMDAIANVENPPADALYASASLSAMQQLWWEGLMTLERVPQASRKPEMVALQKRLWTRVQADRLKLFIQRGDSAHARELLGVLEANATNEAEFTGIIAGFHLQVGDPAHGLALLKRAVESTTAPTASLLLQYGMALLSTNQETEVLAVMRRVAGMGKLVAEDVAAYKNLQRTLSVRYAERAREAGDYASAFNFIQPMLLAEPEDNILLLALAKIYGAAGDSESARDLYGRVLQADPRNPEVLQDLVYAGIQTRDFSTAEQHLATLRQLQPDNPRYLSLAGNLARAQGNHNRALGYFREALAMEQAQSLAMGQGANGVGVMAQSSQSLKSREFSINPFSDRNGRGAGNSNYMINAYAAGSQGSQGSQQQAMFAPPGTAYQQPVQQYAQVQPQHLPQYQPAALPPVPQLPVSVGRVASTVASVPTPTIAATPTATSKDAFSKPGLSLQAEADVGKPAVQGGSSGNVSSVSGGATVYQIPVADIRRSPLPPNNAAASNITSSVTAVTAMLADNDYGSAATAPQAPYIYIPPKPSSYKPEPPVQQALPLQPAPQQYSATGNAVKAAPAYSNKTKPAQPVSAEEASLQKEIDSINELSRTQVSVEVAGRSRSGEKGLSALNGVEIPIEAQISTLGLGQFGLKIIPVLADAGSLNLNDASVAGQFGRNAILVERAKYAKLPFTTIAGQQGLSKTSSLDQEAKGVALNLSYELAGVRLDLGSSPIGFPIQNVVGGLRWSGQSDDGLSLGIELARRSVTDSYLSYAGAKDSLYGLTWGGVTRTGGKLDLSYDGEDGGVYASAGYAALTGKNVAKNTMAEVGAGAYWRAYKTNDFSFTTGLGLTSFFYNKNLRYFTYGHGGYFSPKSYVALGIPLDIAGRKGKLAYQIGASLGVQHFRELGALYYPNSPADQAELELFAAANPTVNIQTSYPGQSRTAFAFKIGGAAEYQLSPHFFVGGKFSADNSGDFNDTSAAVYLRYSFEPKKAPVTFPPVAPKAYYQGN